MDREEITGTMKIEAEDIVMREELKNPLRVK